MKLDWSSDIEAIHDNVRGKRDILNRIEEQFERCMKALENGQEVIVILSDEVRLEVYPTHEIGPFNMASIAEGVDDLLEHNRALKELHRLEQKLRDGFKDNPEGMSLLNEYIKSTSEQPLYNVQLIKTENGIDEVERTFNGIFYAMARQYFVGTLHGIGILFS